MNIDTLYLLSFIAIMSLAIMLAFLRVIGHLRDIEGKIDKLEQRNKVVINQLYGKYSERGRK